MLLVFLALMPTVPAIDVWGGPGTSVSGLGEAGGGAYTITVVPAGFDRYQEVGIEAWARTAAEGVGTAYAAFEGSQSTSTTYPSVLSPTIRQFTLDTFYSNAVVKVGVEKTADVVVPRVDTQEAYSVVYANGYVDEDNSQRTGTVGGSAVISSVIGPHTQRSTGLAVTAGFSAKGEGYAIASGSAGYDVYSKYTTGSANEIHEAYGLAEGKTRVDAKLDQAEDWPATGEKFGVVGDAKIKANSYATETVSFSDSEISAGRDSASFVAAPDHSGVGAKKLVGAAGANGLANVTASAESTTGSVAGAWDKSSYGLPHIRDSSENAYSKVSGKSRATAQACRAAAAGAADEAYAADIIRARSAQNGVVQLEAEGHVLNYAWATRPASTGIGLHMVSGEAYADNAVTKSWAKRASKSASQYFETCGNNPIVQGFGSGAHLKNPAGTVSSGFEYAQIARALDENGAYKPTLNTFLGNTETAAVNFGAGQADSLIVPAGNTFEAVTFGLPVVTTGPAFPQASLTSQDAAGSWATVRNAEVKTTEAATYSTNIANQ